MDLPPAVRLAELEAMWNAHPAMKLMGARVDLSTPGLVFASAELRDQHGTMCARCDGIVAVSSRDTGEPAPRVSL